MLFKIWQCLNVNINRVNILSVKLFLKKSRFLYTCTCITFPGRSGVYRNHLICLSLPSISLVSAVSFKLFIEFSKTYCEDSVSYVHVCEVKIIFLDYWKVDIQCTHCSSSWKRLRYSSLNTNNLNCEWVHWMIPVMCTKYKSTNHKIKIVYMLYTCFKELLLISSIRIK